MLASHTWLTELTGLSLQTEAVARRLTAAGIEVESVRRHGEGLERVVVAEVRGMKPHPKRDKLRLVTVFDGQAEQEVVCGAPNVPGAGRRVVLAQLGARLPGGLEIAPRELGGVVSQGMLCSERELDAGGAEAGIIVLDAAADGRPGELAAQVLGLRDSVYELGLTPNRPDCLGHIGLARELCALFGAPFRLPLPRPVTRQKAAPPGLFPQRDAVFELPFSAPAGAKREQDGPVGFAATRVEIEDAGRCPRYAAGLVGEIKVTESPFWLRHRLHLLGQRPINNIVDATNYMLLMWGHPIHAFDHDRVRGSRIVVRTARAGEHMRTLDGVLRELSGDDLLICDAEGPVALAGVMGGENSEVAAGTQRVLIEVAYFDPRSVRRTSKRTGLHTEASHRFERGVDPCAVRDVLAHASALIAELGGGYALAQALDVNAQPIARRTVALRLDRITGLLGQPFERAQVAELLRGIGCELCDSADGFAVSVPTHRPDVTLEVDLIEEVSRLAGYDSLPSELPPIAPSTEGTPEPIKFIRRLREAAASAGLYESINYAFVAPQDLKLVRASENAVQIVNPLSEERSVLRTSLLPGLGANLRLAQSQQQKSFAQFELARVFLPRPDERLPEERHQLALLLWGERRLWYTEGEHFDFYDAKAALESIVRAVGGGVPGVRIDDALDRDAPALHPRRRARVVLAEQAIGLVGELHPDVVTALELSGRPIWAVLDVADLAQASAAFGVAQTIPLARFPSATRDVAVVVPEAAVAGEVGDALREAAGPLAESVILFDIYRGEPVPHGTKSLAFHVVYRDPEATLTDKVVDSLHAEVLGIVERRFGGSVRR
jgi:phenylalanyl-tRNA synthetase beta chain